MITFDALFLWQISSFACIPEHHGACSMRGCSLVFVFKANLTLNKAEQHAGATISGQIPSIDGQFWYIHRQRIACPVLQ
jgi:hypothetical protein